MAARKKRRAPTRTRKPRSPARVRKKKATKTRGHHHPELWGLGLVVAIPAVWIYNYLTARIEYFNVEMDNSSSELVDYFIRQTA